MDSQRNDGLHKGKNHIILQKLGSDIIFCDSKAMSIPINHHLILL